MKKLITDSEEDILKAVQKHYPISWFELVKVWNILDKSFDLTIKILELAMYRGEDFYYCACKAKDEIRRFGIFNQ